MAKYGVRKNGNRWVARPYVPGRGHIYVKGSFDTEAEATKAALDLIDAQRKLPAHRETVATFAKRWVDDRAAEKPLKLSTQDRYSVDTARFAAEFGSKKLDEISAPQALGYARRHRHDLGSVRAMFTQARKEGLVLSNPFSELGISKGPGRRDYVAITEEELVLLGDLALRIHGKKFGPMFNVIIDFAAYTTMRPSEIFGLDVPDVDLEREVIHVRRQFYKRRIQEPKYGKRVLPYIPPAAARAITGRPRRVPKAVCPVTENEILFPGKGGQRISANSLSGYWSPVRAAFEASLTPERRAELRDPRPADKPEMDFYELRHFGATLIGEMPNVEDWVGARMMGHKDGGKLFRELYSHRRDEVAQQRLRAGFKQNVRPLRAADDEEEATG